MLVFKLAFISSAKAGFKGEDARDLKLTPESDTLRRLFRFVHAKARVLKAEKVEQLTHDEWEHARLVRALLKIVSIHEDILAAGVSMKIAAKYHLPFSIKVSHHALYMPVDGMQVL